MDMIKHAQEDIMEADKILAAMEKLVEREKSEPETEDEKKDVRTLEEAIAHMKEFVGYEEDEVKEAKGESPEEPAKEKEPMIKKEVVMGPLHALRNSLIQKTKESY